MSKNTMTDVINVMLSGLPGKMASLVAKFILSNNNMNLHDFAFTGGDIEQSEWEYSGEPERKIHLIKPDLHEKTLSDLVAVDKHPIIVDFTQPDAVNKNADLYCKYRMPFVMGTTEGDRNKLEETIKRSEISAVVAPNMGEPLVLVQAMWDYAAQNFPNALKNFYLEIKESHQSTKKGTSGTAKAMKTLFEKLGVIVYQQPNSPDDIKSIRNKEEQLALGVPEKYLDAHGYHWYNLKNKDKTVEIDSSTKVNGREVYAFGTIDAITFLNKKIKEGSKGQVYSMIDVLKELK